MSALCPTTGPENVSTNDRSPRTIRAALDPSRLLSSATPSTTTKTMYAVRIDRRMRSR
jgi:hypothetical protein